VAPVENAPFHFEVFENEYVRFSQRSYPARQGGGLPFHRLCVSGYRFDGSPRDHGFGQAHGAGIVESRQVVFGGYSKAPLIHQVANAGQSSFHVMGIEILDSQPGRFSPSTRTDVPAYTSVLDNERVRGWRLMLQPGESAAAIVQTSPGVRIVVQGGDIVEIAQEKPDHELNLNRGDFVWQVAGTTRAVRNVGTSPVEWVEFELK
jgi:mannose-6-phosphate isomerase-like protein (cupin superfamily)